MSMKALLHAARGLMMVALTIVIGGCAGQQFRSKSSVVDYLYPKSSSTVIQPGVPTLSLPLKVGIAFVPEQASQSRGLNLWTGMNRGQGLTEAKKTELLDRVAEHFRGQDFISSIDVIPSTYLRPGGSFSNLDQIRSMYDIDVIALVSYDQVQFTDEGALSMTYWTLVGAYVISAEKNDTSTLLDTAVYDIASRKMLFRAPGTSTVRGNATPINLSEELRRDSLKSFTAATDDMIRNLDIQLNRFKEKIRNKPEQVNIVRQPGYSGGGVLTPATVNLLLLSLVIAVGRRALRRQHR
jgi:rhombotail lipoprotein